MNGRRSFENPRAFPSRARPQAELRAGWLAAIELAPKVANDALAMFAGAQAAPSGQPGQLLTRFDVSLRDLAIENFPVSGQAARITAAAFLACGRGFAQPQGDAGRVRAVLAPMLAAAASVADSLMSELRSTEANAWRRATGERDDG